MGCAGSAPREDNGGGADEARAREASQHPVDAAEERRRSIMRDSVRLEGASGSKHTVPRRGARLSSTLAAAMDGSPDKRVFKVPNVAAPVMGMVANYMLRHALADLTRFREAVHLAHGDSEFAKGLSAADAKALREAARDLGMHGLTQQMDDRLAGHAGESVAEPKSDTRFVVLTGGPCGGKTQALGRLTAKLEDSGYDVYLVGETPTLLINGGCQYPGEAKEAELIEFETALIHLQIQMEESFRRVADSTPRPSVVFLDRALLDVSAYLPPEMWRRVLAANRLTEEAILKRYHLVLHLVTAADGAESFYTLSNNTARRETAEEARALDRRIADAWRAHPSFTLVGNESDFEHKLERVVDAVNGFLGEAPSEPPPSAERVVE